MAFTCATPLSSRATPFVPRRLASPYETTNCRQDSDCGSSSGVGGMKTQEHGSEESPSSSEAHVSIEAVQSPPPPPFFRPPMAPMAAACMPPLPLPLNGLPSWVHPTPPGASNDLFVHIQVGETLSMVVGNDVQHIHGPATVRMVGESGISPSALPIHVPPGHMIHQIVDDQGILRHLILSPEPPPRPPPSVPTPSSNVPPRMMSPPDPLYHPDFYTVDRKWTPNNHSVEASMNGHDSPETDLDAEEFDRVREMLSRILAPQICRVSPFDADISWQELDTSEAAAPGGPFPQIDASEFTYHIVLFESQGRFVGSYRCEPESGNKMRLITLRPNTDYYVQLKASLEERGLAGEPSQPVCFKTAAWKPESPPMPKVLSKGCDWAYIGWRPPMDNGAPILSYCVYLTKTGSIAEKVWEGKTTEMRLQNLRPASSYQVRVTASNRLGESQESHALNLNTRSDGPPPQPMPPTVVQLNARSVKLGWQTAPDQQYTLEQHDVSNDMFSSARERITSGTAFIGDLAPGCEYRFRVQVHNSEGDSPKSDWTSVRMPGKLMGDRPFVMERILIPSRPHVIGQNRRKTEIGWKCQGAKEKEFTYNLEGSTFQNPAKFKTLYKGTICVFILTEESIQNLRVQSINKKGQASDFSEVLVLPNPEEEEIAKPAQISALNLTPARASLAISWEAPEVQMPATSTLMFEVRRIDGAGGIVYAGSDTNFTITGLGNKEHVEVQVRAVIITRDGVRIEGDWSSVRGGTSLRDAPRPPRELRVNLEQNAITWIAADTSSDVRYRVYCNERSEEGSSEERVHETSDCRYPMSTLIHARNYRCKVVAFHDGGESVPSEEIYFTTPAGVPAQPESVSLEAEDTTTLILRWAQPDSRGDSIEQYRIVVETKTETVQDSLHPAPATELRITDLHPDTNYRVEISARNSVGTGVSAAVTARTRALPPQPPKLYCDTDSTHLKLRWKPQETHHLLTYKLVRVFGEDHTVTLYEGDMCSHKVRSLVESTEYMFKIRSSDRETGPGPWSHVYSFRTNVSPPPSVKSPPTACPAGTGYYQIEWTPVIPKPNSKKSFYRLQAVDCSLDNARWHTVYEGGMNSFTLRVSDYPSAVQARVLCVRPDSQSGEIVGNPSPVVYIANHVVERKQDAPSICEPDMSRKRGGDTTWRSFLENNLWLAVLSFIVLSVLTAFFSNQLFNMQTPQAGSGSER